MLTLNWIGSRGGGWYPLHSDFSKVFVSGVYLIWHNSSAAHAGRFIKIGQGKTSNVGCRLSELQKDPAVLAYQRYGDLYVSWAVVLVHQIDGVERYLGEHLKPLIEGPLPDILAIPVNLPGQS